MGTTVVMVPGYTGSGPGHWQSLWQARHPAWGRVEQRDWDNPDRGEWVAALDTAVGGRHDVVLVAHSLGCITVAHWALLTGRAIRGAMLVAPTDVDSPDVVLPAVGFSPIPLQRLPWPTLVVASENDPFVTLSRAAQVAEAWGATFVNVGAADHLNTSSGHGPWREGEELLLKFMDTLR